MWSFAEPLGSHSPCTELKTHYSEQLHCYNNTLATLGATAVVSQYISVVLEIVHRGVPIRCKVIIGIMKGLRNDLVLSLIVIASHYVDVLVDLLNV